MTAEVDRQAAHALLEKGYAHHQAGRLDEAAARYREAIARSPRWADAHHLLGALELQRGRLDAATHAARRAIELGADGADPHYNLGLALARTGKVEEATRAFSEAVRLNPEFAPALNNLGNTLRELGRLDEALARYEQAIALVPDHVDALHNAGVILLQSGRAEDALARHERALRHAPADHEGHFLAGNALRRLGRDRPAVNAYRRAVELAPGFAPAWNALGLTLRDAGETDAALDAYRRGIAAAPTAAELHNNLGITLKTVGSLEEAAAAFERALALDPAAARIANNVADTLQHQGRIDEAIAWYRRALDIENLPAVHSGLFFCRHYDPGFDESASIAEARRWDRHHAAPQGPLRRDFANEPAPDRRLRVGYLSADLCRHPVGFFFGPVIETHDRSQVEVVCYAGVERPDEITARLRGVADAWHDVADLDDATLAQRIVDDRIDILAELGAHTRGHRLLVLARRAAPVQLIAGGHFDTSGLTEADYILADRHHLPAGSEHAFSETAARLPDGYVCYRAPAYAPPVAPAPCHATGRITFGCFSRVQKVTGFSVELWARVLAATPGSRLRLQAREWDDPPTRDRYATRFARLGIDRSRIDFVGGLTHDALLAEYASVDLMLDTYPYSGGLTTCEALWMGVPVVTLTGPTFAGRHSTGHLRNVGLGDLVSETPDAFVSTAAALAREPARIARIRTGLREQVARSPLGDVTGYTGHLEAAYREMWHTWCRRSSHDFGGPPANG